MNPNDILQQQQAYMDQMMHRTDQACATLFIFSLVFTAVGGWVIYMFYARLRDIAQELMILRTAYQFANNREEKRQSRLQNSPAQTPDNPFAGPSTPDKFRPKPGTD